MSLIALRCSAAPPDPAGWPVPGLAPAGAPAWADAGSARNAPIVWSSARSRTSSCVFATRASIARDTVLAWASRREFASAPVRWSTCTTAVDPATAAIARVATMTTTTVAQIELTMVEMRRGKRGLVNRGGRGPAIAGRRSLNILWSLGCGGGRLVVRDGWLVVGWWIASGLVDRWSGRRPAGRAGRVGPGGPRGWRGRPG